MCLSHKKTGTHAPAVPIMDIYSKLLRKLTRGLNDFASKTIFDGLLR